MSGDIILWPNVAEAAYEAYHKAISALPGTPLPPWRKLSHHERTAWMAAIQEADHILCSARLT